MPRPIWGVAALFAVLTVVMTAPFSLHVASRVVSTGTDTDLMVWTLGWDVHAIATHPWAIFDANIFFPHHNTLAYSENLIGSVLIAAPVTWLTGNPVLAMNLVVLVATMLCGVGAYVLGQRVGLSTAAAIVCGVVFAFVPPRLARLDQVHIATIQWIPFSLAYLHSYLGRGRARDLRWAIGFFALQALTSGHGAAFLTLGVLLTLAVSFAGGVPVAPGRRLRDVGIVGALLVVPVVWVYLPYRLAQQEVGLRRPLNDWSSLTWSSFVTSPSHVQTWLISLLPVTSVLREAPNAWFFPGLLTIALAALAFWPTRTVVPRSADQPDPRWTYLVVLVATVALAAGPPFGIWRWVYWLPGLSFVRVPSRFLMLGMLAFAVLAGVGLDRLLARLPPRRRSVAAVGVAVCLLAEFLFAPLDGVAYRVTPPPIDQWLATQSAPFAVADVPLPDSANFVVRDRAASAFMLQSMAHWQPIVEGYSGTQPPDYGDLYWPLTRFPDEGSLRLLSALGVKYVVVHFDLLPEADRPGMEASLARWGSYLTLEHDAGSGRAYSVHWPSGK
jgi:hypothetical protein